MFLQVYNQRYLINGSFPWFSLTHNEDFVLNYKNTSQYDANKTIVASFFTESPRKGTKLISSDENRLLIPQPMPGVEMDKLPLAVKNGATDYLLIKKTVINPLGYECNMAGVSYKGFAKQPNRCEVQKGTCLDNQPLDFWALDNEKSKNGEKGVHLLQNYGTPYSSPIIVDPETKEHWLALEYHDEQNTTLIVEFLADDITILTPGKHVQISKVITEIKEKKITFSVDLSNKDLSPAKLFAKAIDCEFDVPDSTNESAIVPPQNKGELKLETQPGKIELTETLKCTVVAGSAVYGNVAKREVLVNPLHRCICYYHCKCKCMGKSLSCEPMEIEDFHAAGFKGSLPILTAKPPHRLWVVAHPLLAILAFLLLLLLLGLIKGLCGVMGRKNVSYYGIESLIYGKRKIKHYHEKDLKKMDVVYDNEGHPINPDTKKPVRVFSEEIIFAMNAFFLCLWPYMKIVEWLSFRKKLKNEDVTSTDESETSSPNRHGDYGKGTDDDESDPSLMRAVKITSRISKTGRKASDLTHHHHPQQLSKVSDEGHNNAARRGSMGRSLKNVFSDSALHTDPYKSNPDLAFKNQAKQNWQKEKDLVTIVTKK